MQSLNETYTNSQAFEATSQLEAQAGEASKQGHDHRHRSQTNHEAQRTITNFTSIIL